MKLNEMRQLMSTPDGPPVSPPEGEAYDTTESVFDDEDFIEAIDLLETSRQILTKLICTLEDHLGSNRVQHLTNHCDDIKQFLDLFIIGDDDAPDAV